MQTLGADDNNKQANQSINKQNCNGKGNKIICRIYRTIAFAKIYYRKSTASRTLFCENFAILFFCETV